MALPEVRHPFTFRPDLSLDLSRIQQWRLTVELPPKTLIRSSTLKWKAAPAIMACVMGIGAYAGWQESYGLARSIQEALVPDQRVQRHLQQVVDQMFSVDFPQK